MIAKARVAQLTGLPSMTAAAEGPVTFGCFFYRWKARLLSRWGSSLAQGIGGRVRAPAPTAYPKVRLIFCRARCPHRAAGWIFSQGYFAAPAASDFLDAQKVTKKALGGGDNRIRLRLILHDPHPLDPHYGGHPLRQAESFRRAKSGVLGCGPIRPHWGPEWEEN